jgi:hypothetical protein
MTYPTAGYTPFERPDPGDPLNSPDQADVVNSHSDALDAAAPILEDHEDRIATIEGMTLAHINPATAADPVVQALITDLIAKVWMAP